MKRLLISSLLGCMLMGQMQAGSLITKESAVAFAKGAGIASLALLIPRTIVMLDSGLLEDKEVRRFGGNGIAVYPKYLLPSNRITDNQIKRASGYSQDTINGMKNDKDYQAADNRNINWNRIAAGLSTLLFGSSVAKLLGFLPLYFGEKEAMIGIATGSTLSLLSLARNLTKPSYKIN